MPAQRGSSAVRAEPARLPRALLSWLGAAEEGKESSQNPEVLVLCSASSELTYEFL